VSCLPSQDPNNYKNYNQKRKRRPGHHNLAFLRLVRPSNQAGKQKEYRTLSEIRWKERMLERTAMRCKLCPASPEPPVAHINEREL
jgi:hypothetical protein